MDQCDLGVVSPVDAAQALIKLGTAADPTSVPQTADVGTQKDKASTTDATDDKKKKEGERRIVLHIVRQKMNQEEPTFKKICDADPNFWGASNTTKRTKWQRMRAFLMLHTSLPYLIDKIRTHCPEQLKGFNNYLSQCELSRLPNEHGSIRKRGRPRKATPAAATPSPAPKRHKATTTATPNQNGNNRNNSTEGVIDVSSQLKPVHETRDRVLDVVREAFDTIGHGTNAGLSVDKARVILNGNDDAVFNFGLSTNGQKIKLVNGRTYQFDGELPVGESQCYNYRNDDMELSSVVISTTALLAKDLEVSVDLPARSRIPKPFLEKLDRLNASSGQDIKIGTSPFTCGFVDIVASNKQNMGGGKRVLGHLIKIMKEKGTDILFLLSTMERKDYYKERLGFLDAPCNILPPYNMHSVNRSDFLYKWLPDDREDPNVKHGETGLLKVEGKAHVFHLILPKVGMEKHFW